MRVDQEVPMERPTEATADSSAPSARPPQSAAAPTAWIDFARVCAMGAVVLVHAFAPLVSTTYTDLGTTSWWAAHTVDAALRWCVPVFIMISGALLLRPRVEAKAAFYRKRWARIGLPILAWTAVYLVWEMWRGDIDASGAARDAASGSPAIHLYFLYVIAGLYVLTPFLRTIVANTSRAGLWGFAGLMSGLGVLDQTLSLVEGVGGSSAVTQFLPFLGYFMLGWLLHQGPVGSTSLRTGALAFGGGFALILGGAWLAADAAGEWAEGAEWVYDYLSPAVILASIGAFLLLREAGMRIAASERRSVRAVTRVLGWASGLSFGVYLIHVLLLEEFRGLLGTPEGPAAVGAAFGYASLVCAVSLVIVMVMKRIPWLRETV